MIFVNGEPAEINSALKGELMREIGEKGKRIKYPERFFKMVAVYDREGRNTGQKVKEGPLGRNFALSAMCQINNKKNNDNYLRPDRGGDTCHIVIGKKMVARDGIAQVLTPERFKGPVTLYPKDYELYWFLKYICPFVENGENAGTVSHYEIENKHLDAKKKVGFIKHEAKVNYMLTGDEEETGITEAKLKELAMIYRCSDFASRSREEIVAEILGKIKIDASTKEFSDGHAESGNEFFISVVQDKEESKYRVMAQASVDEEIVTLSHDGKSWRYVANRAKLGLPEYYGEHICNILPDQKPYGALVAKLRVHKLTYDTVNEMLGGFHKTPEDQQKALEESMKQKAAELTQSGQYAEAISVWEELSGMSEGLKTAANLQIGKLKKRLVPAEPKH